MGTSIILRRDFIEAGKRIEQAIEKGIRTGEQKRIAARIKAGELLLGDPFTFCHGHDVQTTVTATLVGIEDGYVMAKEKTDPKNKMDSGLHAIFCPVEKPSRLPKEQA